MNWRVAALVLVGLAAAVAAAVLVAALQAGNKAQRASATEVEVLVAADDLPVMKIVDAACVARKKLPLEQARDGLRDSVQVVGKALSVPMAKDQVFKADYFASKSSAYNLASALPAGMRAVTLMLSADEALKNLVYPGGMVDVLAYLKMPAAREGEKDEQVSVTLLRGVQVLAVDARSIVSSSKDQATPVPEEGSSSRKLLVTLMVSPKDAELLQLAQQYGQVSLTMRNPMDDSREEASGTPLSQLVRLYRRPEAAPPPRRPAPIPALTLASTPAALTKPAEPVRWQTVIYRGGQSEVETFSMPAGR
jgi:pilus assembly protein CpaB